MTCFYIANTHDCNDVFRMIFSLFDARTTRSHIFYDRITYKRFFLRFLFFPFETRLYTRIRVIDVSMDNFNTTNATSHLLISNLETKTSIKQSSNKHCFLFCISHVTFEVSTKLVWSEILIIIFICLKTYDNWENNVHSFCLVLKLM